MMYVHVKRHNSHNRGWLLTHCTGTIDMTCGTLVCTILFTLHNFYLYDGIHKLQAVSEQRITHGKVIVGEDKQCVCVCVCCVLCVLPSRYTHIHVV